MQVGPDIHLLYEGKFYLPDVLAEHKPRLFNDFNPEQGKGLSRIPPYHSGSVSAKTESCGSGSTTLFLRRKILIITANNKPVLDNPVIFYCIVKDLHATEKAFSLPEKNIQPCEA
jgi:hypothetical protein